MRYAYGAHVPDEVDEKCRETIDAIVRASVACGGVCALVSAVLVVGVGVFM